MKNWKTLCLCFAAFLCLILLTAPKANAATEGIYTYEVRNGEAMITGCNRSVSGIVNIPETLGGYPVTSIGWGAFLYCQDLVSVDIPDGVKSISNEAFYGCTSLVMVDFPDCLETIGSHAFADCSLNYAFIPESVYFIDYNAFAWNGNLTGVYVLNDNCIISSTPAAMGSLEDNGVMLAYSEVETLGTPGVATIFAKEGSTAQRFAYNFGYRFKVFDLIPLPPEKNAITEQPKSVTVEDGGVAQFSVKTSGEVASYEWSYNKGSRWSPTRKDGWNTSQLTVAGTGHQNGQLFRCTVTFADGTKITSEAAELTVKTNITIKTQPVDKAVVPGGKALFSAGAIGYIDEIQWQYCPENGKWTDIKGENKMSLLVKDQVDNRNWQYRCKFTDVTGVVAYTNAARMQVLYFLEVPANTEVNVGETASFHVALNKTEDVTYRWQYSKNGIFWYDTTMEGYNTDTLKMPATKARNGYQYRCVITDPRGGKLVSEEATLNVDWKVRVTGWNSLVTTNKGSKAEIKVQAVNAVSYQWQYQRPGSEKWFNTTMDGCNTPELLVDAIAARNGYKYRCVIHGPDGTEVISQPTTLTVK